MCHIDKNFGVTFWNTEHKKMFHIKRFKFMKQKQKYVQKPIFNRMYNRTVELQELLYKQ